MGFKILSDIDIVNTVLVSEGRGDSESEDDFADDVSQTSASAPTHAEAFTVLKTVMSWYETQPESNEVKTFVPKTNDGFGSKENNSKSHSAEYQCCFLNECQCFCTKNQFIHLSLCILVFVFFHTVYCT